MTGEILSEVVFADAFARGLYSTEGTNMVCVELEYSRRLDSGNAVCAFCAFYSDRLGILRLCSFCHGPYFCAE